MHARGARSLSTGSGGNPLGALVSLCKRRGFVFHNAELYGGQHGTYDYGPYGAELKRNVEGLWWKHFVHARRPHVWGLDSALITAPQVLQASGHVENFIDPLVECKACKKRFRADKLEHLDHCPCREKAALTEARNFNLLFETHVGPVSGDAEQGQQGKQVPEGGGKAYLRPETAQGTFINLDMAQAATRGKLPFGLAQIGKSFRNEISPGNFVFRTREFDQAELQWFCPRQDAPSHFTRMVNDCVHFLTSVCGLSPTNIRVRHYSADELAHYARATVDIEYKYPFGWGELWGIADRGSYDLEAHRRASGAALGSSLAGPDGELPSVIEPALGINRLILAILSDSFVPDDEVGGASQRDAGSKTAETEQQTGSHTTQRQEKKTRTQARPAKGASRVVLRFHPNVAPFKFAIMPVVTAVPQLVRAAEELHRDMLQWTSADLDVSGASVGKRYRRQDEVGTPFCVCIDSAGLEQGTATVRFRDSMRQEAFPLAELRSGAAWPAILGKYREDQAHGGV